MARSLARGGVIAGTFVAAAFVLGLLLAPAQAGVRAPDQQAPTITTVAGTGVAGRAGDGGPATAALIGHPRGITALAGGGFLFAEPFNNTVRRVRADGTIVTVAGTGEPGLSGDGGPAVAARLDFVHGVAVLPDGGFVLADMFNNRIRRVDPGGTITTVAGNGVAGFSGDGGPAAQASLNLPRGVSALPSGEILVPDSSNHRVRRIGLDGRITTVAGTGVAGYSGDGGPATSAQLDVPFGISPTADGGFLVVERRGNRVRRVEPDGTITTVAGTGLAGYSGDGGAAVAARLDAPHAVVALPDGGFLVADTANHRVRRVDPGGKITTVAGTGERGFAGDGGSAEAAQLDEPKALAVRSDLRGVLVGDASNNRVRLVSLDLRPPFQARFRARAYRARVGKPTPIGVTSSLPAHVQILVTQHDVVLSRPTRRLEAGAARILVRAPRQPGAYGVRLVARSNDGRTATDRAVLRVRR